MCLAHIFSFIKLFLNAGLDMGQYGPIWAFPYQYRSQIQINNDSYWLTFAHHIIVKISLKTCYWQNISPKIFVIKFYSYGSFQ